MPNMHINVLTFIYLATFVADSVPLQTAGVREFCQFDTFVGRCTDDEVIAIDHAQYGRMRGGRCISGEGYIGCHTDVRVYFDGQCAGRQVCNVTVTSLTDVVQPCRRDYTSYLEVAYSCVKTVHDASDSCRRRNVPGFELTDSKGLLASSALVRQLAGSEHCPWTVRAEPGQRIQLKLTVYRPGTDSILAAVAGGAHCPWNIVVQEEKGDFRNHEKLCSKNKNERTLYTSESNSVRFYFLWTGEVEDVPVFVLQYQILGCRDVVPDIHSGLTVQRDGDQLSVHCRDTGNTWYLTCTDNHWAGEDYNCTGKAISDYTKKDGFNIPFPQGLIVAVILGLILGLVIGTGSLIGLYAYRRRKRQRSNDRELDDDYYTREKLCSSAERQDVLYRSTGPYTARNFFVPPAGAHDGTVDLTASINHAQRYPRCLESHYAPVRTPPGVYSCQRADIKDQANGGGCRVQCIHPYESPRLGVQTQLTVTAAGSIVDPKDYLELSAGQSKASGGTTAAQV